MTPLAIRTRPFSAVAYFAHHGPYAWRGRKLVPTFCSTEIKAFDWFIYWLVDCRHDQFAGVGASAVYATRRCRTRCSKRWRTASTATALFCRKVTAVCWRRTPRATRHGDLPSPGRRQLRLFRTDIRAGTPSYTRKRAIRPSRSSPPPSHHADLNTEIKVTVWTGARPECTVWGA